MKLLILGDLSPTPYSAPYFEQMDKETLFTDTLPLYEGHDAVIVNLETTLTEAEQGIRKYGPCLKAPKNTAKVLREIGVTHCALSNNHIFDFGKQGLTDTMQTLDEAGLVYTGVGQNRQDARRDMVIEKNGETVAIIAVCEHEYSYALDNRMGAREFDPYDTLDDVRNAKKNADKVIVLYHGGKEFSAYPSPRVYKLCHALADAGADAVICQHSHCIGSYEIYNGSHILYGQGNYHFVCPESPAPESPGDGWGKGLIVAYDTDADEMEFAFVVNTEHGITLAKGAELAELSSDLTVRSESLEDGTWLDGWRAFVDYVRESYFDRVRTSFENGETFDDYNVIGHLLDCEAHRDVLMEMFPTANRTNELD